MSSDHRKRNPITGREPGPRRERGWFWAGARFPGRRRRDSRTATAADSRPGRRSRRVAGPGATLTLAGDRPVLPPGIRWAIPLGAAAHLCGGLFLLHQAARFRADRLPAPAPHRVQLASLAPAASLLGNSLDPARSPEPAPTGAAAPPIRRPSDPAPPAVLALLDELPITTSFGDGASGADLLPGASPFPGSGTPGRPEGVRGGLPGGLPGGSIHGLRDRGDPVLPPPDEPPAPIAMPRPRFPEAALREGVRGRVVLRALITARGTVEVLRILRSVPALDREAIRVVESEWRFRPARRNGRPTPALSDLAVRFTLR